MNATTTLKTANAEYQNRYYKVTMKDSFYTKVLIGSCVFSALMAALCAIMFVSVIFMNRIDTMQAQYDNNLTSLSNQWQTRMASEVGSLQETFTAQAATYEETIVSLQAQLASAEEQLTDVNEEQNASFDLLSKYWYVLEGAPEDSGLTTESMVFLDEQCKKWDVNPDWMWAIYWVESNWHANISNTWGSGARGLGQVMPKTGEYMWETILDHGDGTFNTNMLFDPEVNMEITVAMIGRSITEQGKTMRSALSSYSGGSKSYYDRVVKAAATYGIALTEDNIHYPD